MKYWQNFVESAKKIKIKRPQFNFQGNFGLILTIIGLTVFFVYVLLISLWLNLPKDKLAFLIEDYIKQNVPSQVTVEVAEANTTLRGLDLNNVTITYNQLNDTSFRIDQVSLHPISAKIFLLKFPFKININNSYIDGDYSLLSDQLNFETKNFLVNNIPSIRSMNLLSGSPKLDLSGYFGRKSGDFETEFELSDIRINNNNEWLVFVPLNLEDVGFDDISGSVNLQNNTQKINIYLNINGSYTGNINIVVNLGSNIINTNFNITLDGRLDEALINRQDDFAKSLITSYLNNSNKVALELDFTGFLQNFEISNK